MKAKRIPYSLIFLLFISLCVGWGPEREVFTIENPAPYITFDSITNNPNYGDERNFCTVKISSDNEQGGWGDLIHINKSEQYTIRIYVENSSIDNLNLRGEDTKIYYNIPHIQSNKVMVMGYIEADNSNPRKIYDQVIFESDKAFVVEYVPGSAEYENNSFINGGIQLSEDILTEKGVLIGYDQLDGEIPPGYQYAGYATIKVNVIVEEDLDMNRHTEVNENRIWILVLVLILIIIGLLVFIIRNMKFKSK